MLPGMNTYDIAVIGGGAAGLSAALVLARARREVVVIDDGRPRNAPATHMQGFLSRDGMPPADLLAVGRTEVAGYGGEFVDQTVSGLMRSPNGTFGVLLKDGGTLLARRVLVTTGLSDRLPDVPGVAERWGRDLLHCPYCHGHEVRDQPLGVLGGTPGAVQHALLIRQWSPDVVFFAHTTRLTDSDRERLTARAIGIVEGEVARLVVEDDRLGGVELADGRRVPRTAVFVRPEFVGNNALVRGLGARTDDAGWPLVDAGGLTSVPGLWVAGNAVNPRAQVITAAGEGSAAAIAINNDLTEEDVRDAVEAFRTVRPT
ncbi:NAD(P)/FAD-dependent oxidoreductase [Streptomyces heilongjiangensis]